MTTEICLIQPPARERRIRDPHYGTYEELAKQVIENLLPYFDRPFGFFGHCGGALPGFATALELHRRGLPTPTCLFISSQVAPHDGPFGRYLHLDDDELREELCGFVRRLGGEPNAELIEVGLTTLKLDLEANRQYVFAGPVRLPGLLRTISWIEDVEILHNQMTGWPLYADTGRFHSTVLPGDHHEFLKAPAALLDALDDGMEQGRLAAMATRRAAIGAASR
ncbi:surfactin synthase thioesterase subunit [Sphingomonas sp. 1185]